VSQQSPVKAFTIGFDDTDYDETAIAREMAESVGADQDILRLQGDHLYDNLPETLWHAERTIYNTLGVAKLLMSRHVNQAGYKVVVTGEGSDELFAGYPAFRRDMFLHGLDTLSGAERAGWEQLLAESNQLFKGAMLAENEVHDPALTPWWASPPAACSPGWPRRPCAGPDGGRPAPRGGGLRARRAIADASTATCWKAATPWTRPSTSGSRPCWRARSSPGAATAWTWPTPWRRVPPSSTTTWPSTPADSAAGDAHQGPYREIRAARGHEGVLPQGALRAREVRLHGAAGAYRPEEVGRHAPPGRPLPDPEAIEEAGLLDVAGVKALFDLHDAPDTTTSTQVQLDAVINHMLGVQILHTALARKKAKELGWAAWQVATVAGKSH
jgi:asparagine synthase (glutamine-hydrolysing)